MDPGVGQIPGALASSSIALDGSGQMPRTAIVVAFRSFSTDRRTPAMTGVQIADTGLQEGQGMHGGFSRANTFNNMAAVGPDFKHGFVDRAPVGNTDIAPTLAHILGLELPGIGSLHGRVLFEALEDGPASVPFRVLTATSTETATGKASVLRYQEAEGRRYFDFACFVDLHDRVTGTRPVAGVRGRGESAATTYPVNADGCALAPSPLTTRAEG